MSDEKDTKKPVIINKAQPNGGFDLFHNFRHSPKMPEPLSQTKLPVKTKGS